MTFAELPKTLPAAAWCISLICLSETICLLYFRHEQFPIYQKRVPDLGVFQRVSRADALRRSMVMISAHFFALVRSTKSSF